MTGCGWSGGTRRLRTWFGSWEPWPPAQRPDAGEQRDLPEADPVEDPLEDPLVEAMGTRAGEIRTPAELIDRLRLEHHVVPPVEAQQAPRRPGYPIR